MFLDVEMEEGCPVEKSGEEVSGTSVETEGKEETLTVLGTEPQGVGVVFDEPKDAEIALHHPFGASR